MDRRAFCTNFVLPAIALTGATAHALAAAPAIRLGMSLPLSGVLSITARQFQEGSRILFETVNTAGGIHGRRVEVSVLDDHFNPERVVQNAQDLVQQGVLALFGFMGTPGLIEVSKFVNSQKIPLIGAVSGAPVVKSSDNRYVFVIRASFSQEASKAVENGVSTGARRWGVVYQDDGQGKAALAGVIASLERHKLEPVMQAAFAPSPTPDLASVVSAIEKDRPSSLIFGGSPPALEALFKLARSKGVTLPATTVLSVVSPDTAISLLGDDAIGLRFMQPVPYPFVARKGSSTEYLAAVKRFSKEPASFVGMEGFLSAKLMVKALELTPLLDREKLVATLESMNDFALTEDFRVTYGPRNRTGSSFVDSMIVGRQRNILR